MTRPSITRRLPPFARAAASIASIAWRISSSEMVSGGARRNVVASDADEHLLLIAHFALDRLWIDLQLEAAQRPYR